LTENEEATIKIAISKFLIVVKENPNLYVEKSTEEQENKLGLKYVFKKDFYNKLINSLTREERELFIKYPILAE
jgi:hypothetical protein